MKRLTCLLLACLTALTLTACGAEKPQEISLFAMDPYMTLAAYGDSADEALTAASREISSAGTMQWTMPGSSTAGTERQTP